MNGYYRCNELFDREELAYDQIQLKKNRRLQGADTHAQKMYMGLRTISTRINGPLIGAFKKWREGTQASENYELMFAGLNSCNQKQTNTSQASYSLICLNYTILVEFC